MVTLHVVRIRLSAIETRSLPGHICRSCRGKVVSMEGKLTKLKAFSGPNRIVTWSICLSCPLSMII